MIMNTDDILKQYTNEDGNIDASKIGDVVKAINNAVGKEFVDKKRYNEKLTEIDTLKGEKQNAEDKATGAEKWKTKYEALKEDFDTYKKDVSAKETKATRENAYRALLKEAGVSEKRIDKVLKVSDIDNLEMGEDGKFKDADKLIKDIKEEWSDFIVSSGTKGATVTTPPANVNGGKISRAEIFKKDEHGKYVLSTAERQKAIAESLSN
jgi:hypothetical protein